MVVVVDLLAPTRGASLAQSAQVAREKRSRALPRQFGVLRIVFQENKSLGVGFLVGEAVLGLVAVEFEGYPFASVSFFSSSSTLAIGNGTSSIAQWAIDGAVILPASMYSSGG